MNTTPNPTLFAATNALEDIRETSLRLNALLDMVTGNGFPIFNELDDDLREAFLMQTYCLAAEISNKAGAVINAISGGDA